MISSPLEDVLQDIPPVDEDLGAYLELSDNRLKNIFKNDFTTELYTSKDL